MDQNLQSNYIYDPLGDKDIRLIDLKPSKNYDDTVECSVLYVPLAKPPAYVALSYCWGSDKQSETMKLYGCTMPAILRKTSNPDKFTLVGHAYVDGFMDGKEWTKNASMLKNSSIS
jgi:hypothetical protein